MENNKDVRRRKLVENGMMAIGIVGSLATIPQIVKVYHTHTQHVDGHSIITWGSYAIIALLWVAYGIYFRKSAIMITNSLYLVMYFLVVFGIIKNGASW